MLRTVEIGSCVMVQGEFVRVMADGQIAVRVEDQIYVGRPVAQRQAA